MPKVDVYLNKKMYELFNLNRKKIRLSKEVNKLLLKRLKEIELKEELYKEYLGKKVLTI